MDYANNKQLITRIIFGLLSFLVAGFCLYQLLEIITTTSDWWEEKREWVITYAFLCLVLTLFAFYLVRKLFLPTIIILSGITLIFTSLFSGTIYEFILVTAQESDSEISNLAKRILEELRRENSLTYWLSIVIGGLLVVFGSFFAYKIYNGPTITVELTTEDTLANKFITHSS